MGRFWLGLYVAVLAAAVALLWARLPEVVHRLVHQEGDDVSIEIQRLRIGHAMAGSGEAGDRAMAEAMKTTLLAWVFGPVQTTSRTAWQSFAASLADAESRYVAPRKGFGLGPPAYAAVEVAEGLRYVAHVTRVALELYVEDSPRFVRMVSPTLKLLGDNPDAMYYISQVDHAKTYRITGCRTAEVYFSIAVHGEAAEGTAFQRVLVDLNDGSINFDGQNCYTIRLSATRPAALRTAETWLKLPASTLTVVTRHYFEADPPAQLNAEIQRNINLSIALVDDPPDRVPPLVTDAEMGARIEQAAHFVRSHTVDMPLPDPTTAPPFFSLTPNVIGPPMKWAREAEGMGAVDIAYGAGRFLLKPGEALVIRGKIPECKFANVVLWNRFLQSFEYSNTVRPISLNRAQLNTNAAGEFTIVLSDANPFAGLGTDPKAQQKCAQANWLYSEGRPTGTAFFRFVLPGEDVQQPTTQVLRLADVATQCK